MPVLFTALRERIAAAEVPRFLPGSAIRFLTAGLMAMVFMGVIGPAKGHTMVVTLLGFSVLTALLGFLLGYAGLRIKESGTPAVDRIDTLLPQTQCGQCGYPGCRPYAQAIAANEAEINRCPPGGEATVHALANLFGRDPLPLDPEREEKPKAVARIDETRCIGCTLCIKACPVDAILGAAKQMHTVIDAECTGCELCVAPCPMDCIEMVPIRPTLNDWHWPFPDDRLAAEGRLPLASQAKWTGQPPVNGNSRPRQGGSL